MTGLILIAVLVAWFFIAKSLSTFFTQKIHSNAIKKLVQVFLFALILVAPVADEIIGGFQFRALCKAEAVAVYDEARVRGKTVHCKSAKDLYYKNTILPTRKTILTFVDHSTNEELISYFRLQSDGGWLRRWINFNSVDTPVLFDGNCSGDKGGYLFQNLSIKDADRHY